MYLVKTGFSVLLAVLYTIIGHQPYPFLPIHLSLISTFGVGIPTFILQMEPSFERVKGSFLSKAFRNAFPSSIMVFLSAVLVSVLSGVFQMREERADMIFVLLTCFTYLYTLYKVYYPPTKLRIGVIWSMAVLILASLLLFQDILKVQAAWTDLLIIIPGAVLVPVITAAISRAYDWIAAKLKLLKRKR
jgi:cation-transporting ATPase E